MPDEEAMRICVLWARLSGYARAMFGALSDLGVDVRVVHRAVDAEAPYDPAAITEGLSTTSWSGAPDARMVESVLEEADPHAVLMTSWHPPAYRRALRRRRGRTIRILCMDNQWWGTPKQRLGVVTSPLLIRPTFDAAFVASDRGADFARRFGFDEDHIIRGVYTCDHDRFASVAHRRGGAVPARAFVFVGRLVASKGVDILAAAYRRYRAVSPDPWPLLVGGTGPGEAELRGIPGVELLGFVQPAQLPSLLGRSGCLVLPSRFEPWGVAVHEAAAAGLPVVCTYVCGAATSLVVDGYNGAIIQPADPDSLARALLRISELTDDELIAASRASTSQAAQFTPARWASHLVTSIRELRVQSGLDVGGITTVQGASALRSSSPVR